jgi:membrane-associated phospholipid phosphatase
MAASRFWRGAGRVSTEMILSMTLFSSILTVLVFLIRPRVRKYKKSDLKVFEAIKRLTNERNTRIMSIVTQLGSHKFLVPANLSLIGYFLFLRRKSWFSIRVASIGLSSLGLMFLFKWIFNRKRPVEGLITAKGLSFPSGHALMSTTFYGLLIYIITQTVQNKNERTFLITSLLILIQSIGFSRIYLRVHYTSDVLVGYITGLAWLLVSLKVLKGTEEFNKQKYLPIVTM